MKKTLQILILGAVALMFSACASSSPQKNTLIENPSLLKQSQRNENAYVYIKENTSFKQYNKILVPKIEIKSDEEKKLNSELANEISSYFTRELYSSLNSVVSNNPGDNVLKLDIGIDSVEVGYENLKVWQFIPISLAVTAISRGTGISDKDLNVAIALRLKDQTTQEIIARAVDTRKREGVKSLEKLKFEDVQPLLDKWVNAITQRLVELNK